MHVSPGRGKRTGGPKDWCNAGKKGKARTRWKRDRLDCRRGDKIFRQGGHRPPKRAGGRIFAERVKGGKKKASGSKRGKKDPVEPGGKKRALLYGHEGNSFRPRIVTRLTRTSIPGGRAISSIVGTDTRGIREILVHDSSFPEDRTDTGINHQLRASDASPGNEQSRMLF